MQRQMVFLVIVALFTTFFAGYLAGQGSSRGPSGKAVVKHGPSEFKQA
jgi:hypothetical protein